MSRNTLAGKSTGTSKSAKFYKDNKEANDKKIAYQKKYNKKEGQVKYRSELNSINRKAGTYGNKDGKDASHLKKGGTVMEIQSKNRARQGADGKSTKR